MVPAVGESGDLGGVLLRRQNFLQNCPQLYFSQNAAGLDVGQHLFQVAYAHRQRLHFAKPLIDLLQPAADQLKGLSDLLVQGLCQFLVDGGLDLCQTVLLLCLHAVQICCNGRANLLHALCIGAFQISHTTFKLPQPCVHVPFHLFQSFCLIVAGLPLIFRQQIPQHLHLVLGVGSDLLPQGSQGVVVLGIPQLLYL